MNRSRRIQKRNAYRESRLMKESPVRFGKEPVAASVPFKDTDALEKALFDYGMDSTIRTLSNNTVKKSEDLWQQIAHSRGFQSATDPAFIDNVVKVLGKYGTFGIEVLYMMSNDPRLYPLTDFALSAAGDGNVADFIVWSYIYGGKRLEVWNKYCKRIKDPTAIVEGFVESDGMSFGAQVIGVDKNTFRIIPESDSDKKEIVDVLNSMEKVFDFDIDEPMSADEWTVHVAKGSGDNDIFDGTDRTVKMTYDPSDVTYIPILKGDLGNITFSMRMNRQKNGYIGGTMKDYDNISARNLADVMTGMMAAYGIKIEVSPDNAKEFLTACVKNGLRI